MKINLLSLQLVGAGLALLLANGCVIKGDDVNDDGETGDGDGDPGDGDGDPGDGDGAPGDGDGAPGDGDGAPGDGDGDPTEGPNPAIVEACNAACSVLEACEGSFPECNDACVEAHLEYGDDVECLELDLALTQCIGTLSCEELTQFMEEDPIPYPCQQEYEASCGGIGEECLISIGGGENPAECSVFEQCGEEPEVGVECDGQTCTCYVDNVEVGGCADAAAICEDLDTAYEACCG